jgi:hypothetical protein
LPISESNNTGSSTYSKGNDGCANSVLGPALCSKGGHDVRDRIRARKEWWGKAEKKSSTEEETTKAKLMTGDILVPERFRDTLYIKRRFESAFQVTVLFAWLTPT